ncbi:sugar O-methyltransferase, partial [Alphaproteobacteria bacterium]|nr:sugar O-methyltransferase [Alphaproteobacteria bacterium]
ATSGMFHHFMQRRWRNIAKSYASFGSFDSSMAAICKFKDKAYSLDALRQTLTLAALDATGVLGRDRIALVIGDGFANMTSLLISSGVAQKVIIVNLNTTLYVDLLNLIGLPQLTHKHSVQLVTNKGDAKAALANNDVKVIALQVEKQSLLAHLNFDLAFNIASMQEMDLSIIRSYFDQMRTAARNGGVHFYCCNRESKTLPDGSLINFADYGWQDNDVHIIDEVCDWHRHYYRRYLPFYFKYDGELRHRFTVLAAD